MNKHHLTFDTWGAKTVCQLCGSMRTSRLKDEDNRAMDKELCDSPRHRLLQVDDISKASALYEYGYRLLIVTPDTLKAGNYIYTLEYTEDPTNITQE